jgi:hypothetical protein
MARVKRMKIYVAGPYTNGDPGVIRKNVRNAIDAGIRIWKKGHYPFIPHLTHFVEMRARKVGVKLGWRDYIEWDMPWLECCDAVLYLGHSKGAKLEVDVAISRGLIIYHDLADIPRTSKPR